MQVSRIGRLIVGAMVAVLVCQTGMVLAGTVAYWRFEDGAANTDVVQDARRARGAILDLPLAHPGEQPNAGGKNPGQATHCVAGRPHSEGNWHGLERGHLNLLPGLA